MSNQLKNETSPYLLQHAENPVDWYPWGKEAFEKAKREDKPIFLSIGYSTCHWCHVMAHESFENDNTAKILNENFISVKVDREERPDIDSVYMAVCQELTGSGGWPMSIFMTWDKKPFFAGTYFPARSRYGMPGFPDLLYAIAKQWKSDHAGLMDMSEEIVLRIKNTKQNQNAAEAEDLPEKAVEIFEHTFDSVYGGFGTAPKFPTPHNLLFLIMYAKRSDNPHAMKMAEKTLIQMRKGGIFDHIGYGFSRYSTDKYFLAPHFEKMLYDNALLIMAYAAAHSVTKNSIYLDTAEKTAEYIMREMTSCGGGFYSAQDADSEGEEGKYYTFALSEIIDILGEEKGKQFAKTFDITRNGNFEGKNIPNLLKSDELGTEFKEEIRNLYRYRKTRFKLHTDDKILLSWNSMMTAALSMLFRASKNEEYLDVAKKSQVFIEKHLCEDLQLYTSFRDGKHSEHGFLDDYAFYIAALTELYNSSLETDYLKKAEQFAQETVKRFADRKGGFYFCETDNNEFFINPKENYDGAVPSGNSVMAYNFVRLYQLTQKEEYEELARNQMAYMSARAQENPSGYSMFLIAKLMYDSPLEHITVALKNASDLSRIKEKLPFSANISVVLGNDKYPILNGKTTYYICKDNNCLPPVNEL